MKTLLLKLSVQALPVFILTGNALAAGSSDYVGSASEAPQYQVVQDDTGVTLVPEGSGDTGHGADHAVGHAADAAHQASSGLPQMDPTWFPSQIFWLAVTFLCLYAIFAKRILPALSTTIDNRREHVQNDLDAAEKLKEEAQHVHEAYEEILEEARKKSSESFAKADEKIKAETQKKLDDFRDRSLKEIQDAEARISEAKVAAKDDMHTVSAEIAQKAAEKIVGVSTDLKQAKEVITNISRKAA